ncbi:hypothetical protein WME98_09090 [Sorangium sp. So ce296]|uniref:hypothetical protein n=1 Tax=Sorangium sp. So ce296 TaxID=3133296 RepID=UPI003F63EDEF
MYFEERVEERDFECFMASIGGEVIDGDRLSVRFSAGRVHVWIYGARSTLRGVFERPEEGVVLRLRRKPESSVSLVLSSEIESGPLAVIVALQILRRWKGVVQLAVYSFVGPDVENEMGKVSGLRLLGLDISLFFVSSVEIGFALEGFDAIEIDPADRGMVESGLSALRRIYGADFDENEEALAAVVVHGGDDFWLLRRVGSEDRCGCSYEGRVAVSVESRLGGRPMCEYRLVMGCQASNDAATFAVSLAAALLRFSPGVMAGIFDHVLDIGELEGLLASGEGVFVC